MSDLRKPTRRAIFDELVELLGEDDAKKLSSEYGGQRIYVPGKVFGGYGVTNLIGKAAAEKFVLHFGSGPLYIVKPDFAARAKRNAEIIRKFSARVHPNLLAKEYGLSERQIWNIVGNPEPTKDTRQISLF